MMVSPLLQKFEIDNFEGGYIKYARKKYKIENCPQT